MTFPSRGWRAQWKGSYVSFPLPWYFLIFQERLLLFHLKKANIHKRPFRWLHVHKSLRYNEPHRLNLSLSYAMSFCVDKTENSLSLAKLGRQDNWLLPVSAVSRQANTSASREQAKTKLCPSRQWNSCLVPCVELPNNLTGQPLGPWRLSPQEYSLSLLRLLIKNDFIMKLPQIAALSLVVLEAVVKNLRNNCLGFSSLLKTSLSLHCYSWFLRRQSLTDTSPSPVDYVA